MFAVVIQLHRRGQAFVVRGGEGEAVGGGEIPQYGAGVGKRAFAAVGQIGLCAAAERGVAAADKFLEGGAVVVHGNALPLPGAPASRVRLPSLSCSRAKIEARLSVLGTRAKRFFSTSRSSIRRTALLFWVWYCAPIKPFRLPMGLW